MSLTETDEKELIRFYKNQAYENRRNVESDLDGEICDILAHMEPVVDEGRRCEVVPEDVVELMEHVMQAAQKAQDSAREIVRLKYQITTGMKSSE